MRIVRVLFCLLAAPLFSAAVLPTAQADTWNKKTIVTFSQSVEIPGKVLPAGTYTFVLLDSSSDRHIVQIFDADGAHLITTVLAINDYRLKPTGDTVMKFNERAGDSPEALRAWFYPGDNFGQEFVYPKARAMQLALVTKFPIPAVAADTLDDNAIKTVPILAVTPDEKEVEVTTVFQTTPPVEVALTPAPAPAAEVVTPTPVASTPAPVVEAKELPHTASSMPLIAMLGGLSIGLALGLKSILKLIS